MITTVREVEAQRAVVMAFNTLPSKREELVVQRERMLAFLRLCLPWLHDHTRQICSCTHIYACAKLPSGEDMLLAYLLLARIHRNLR